MLEETTMVIDPDNFERTKVNIKRLSGGMRWHHLWHSRVPGGDEEVEVVWLDETLPHATELRVSWRSDAREFHRIAGDHVPQDVLDELAADMLRWDAGAARWHLADLSPDTPLAQMFRRGKRVTEREIEREREGALAKMGALVDAAIALGPSVDGIKITVTPTKVVYVEFLDDESVVALARQIGCVPVEVNSPDGASWWRSAGGVLGGYEYRLIGRQSTR